MAAEENVLCFRRSLLDEIGGFQGISLDVERYFPTITHPVNLVYRRRGEVETDPRYKQLIPYVLIFCGNRMLRYQRGRGGGEARLHGHFSVGIGGHIADHDHDLFSKDAAGYDDGMRREIREEVDVEPMSESVVAVINDDSTEVGAVHFGVVHLMHVADEQVIGRRKGILAPEFVEISKATCSLEAYESWSRFCLEKIDKLLAKATEARSLV